MISAALCSVLATAHLDQGHHAHCVQQKWHSDARQPDQGEEEGEGHVVSLSADVEEAPGAGYLHVIASNAG